MAALIVKMQSNGKDCSRALCFKCNKTVRLRKCGRFFVHGPLEARCLMSDKVPSHTDQVHASQTSVSPCVSSESLLSDIRSVKRRILRFVPRGARVQWAITLSNCIERILQDPTEPAHWRRLLLAPSLCLKQPKRGGHDRKASLASLINRQCVAFLSSKDLLSLQSSTESPRRKKYSKTNDSRLPIMVSKKLDEGDVQGAVRLVSSSDSVAPFDEETLSKLREKHPPRPNDRMPFPLMDVPPLQVSTKDVRSAVESFKPGSSGGLSGLRPQHLRDAISVRTCAAGSTLMTSLTGLVNCMLAGNIPSTVQPVVFGALVTAFNKKEGGVRPIAVGEVVRRLTAKCATQSVKKNFSDVFAPNQLGFGVTGGAEAAAHATRSFVQNANSTDVLLKLDFSNAFNTMRRDHVAFCISKEVPELMPFYAMSYENDSFLTFGDEVLLSSEGFQQGDPLAVLGFCLGLNKELSSVQSRFRIGYIDDVTLGDHWSLVLSDFIAFKAACEKIGLYINPSKCEITFCDPSFQSRNEITQSFHHVCPNLSVTPSEALVMLGAPIGADALRGTLFNQLKTLSHFRNRLKLLHRHDAYFLLKNCLALPKLLYTFRTAPTFLAPGLLGEIEACLRATLVDITNTSINDTRWLQASLPCRDGGLGIPSPLNVALSAYLSSSYSSVPLTTRILRSEPSSHVDEALILWKDMSQVEPPVNPVYQKHWIRPLYDRQWDKLLDDADSFSISRLQGCRSAGSGDWLHALPSGTLGLRLNDEQLTTAIALRLGAPVCCAHICVCGAEVERSAQHALVCNKLKSRHARHRLGNDIILRALKTADVPATLEPLGLSRSDGKRPDGASLLPWKAGKALVWDFTCVHRLAASYCEKAKLKGATVATAAEERKKEKYKDLSPPCIFQPIAVETLGGFGPETLLFLREIGHRISETTNDKRATLFLRQRLSIAVQIGNAACVRESCGDMF